MSPLELKIEYCKKIAPITKRIHERRNNIFVATTFAVLVMPLIIFANQYEVLGLLVFSFWSLGENIVNFFELRKLDKEYDDIFTYYMNKLKEC